MGFQNYGNLTSSLQGLLGMEQSGGDAHPAKRARVQVGLPLSTCLCLKDLLLQLPGLQPLTASAGGGCHRPLPARAGEAPPHPPAHSLPEGG